jgi:Ni2+-binding GTPase involved in maturation of urease and hydrogenase
MAKLRQIQQRFVVLDIPSGPMTPKQVLPTLVSCAGQLIALAKANGLAQVGKEIAVAAGW